MTNAENAHLAFGATTKAGDQTSRPTGPTCSVPQAGAYYFGLGRNASYDAAKRGDIPVVRIGARLRALVAPLESKVISGK